MGGQAAAEGAETESSNSDLTVSSAQTHVALLDAAREGVEARGCDTGSHLCSPRRSHQRTSPSLEPPGCVAGGGPGASPCLSSGLSTVVHPPTPDSEEPDPGFPKGGPVTPWGVCLLWPEAWDTAHPGASVDIPAVTCAHPYTLLMSRGLFVYICLAFQY